jgi:hypothetical protein
MTLGSSPIRKRLVAANGVNSRLQVRLIFGQGLLEQASLVRRHRLRLDAKFQALQSREFKGKLLELGILELDLLVSLRNLPIGMRTANLSITHNFCRELHPEDDICQTCEPAPHDDVAWRRVTLACEIAAELGQLDGVVRQRPRQELRDSRLR